MTLTPTQRLAEALLREQDTSLAAFVLYRVDLGVPAAAIARQLADATAGQVVISGQAIRTWVPQLRDQESAAPEVARM